MLGLVHDSASPFFITKRTAPTEQKGETMDIKADIERVRDLMETLQNWDVLIKEKRFDAIWGHGYGFDSIKVQTTKKNDRIEKAIIDVQKLEERKEAIINQYWTEKERVMRIIERYAKTKDLTPLHRYLIGFELEQIPLTGKQKDPKTVVNAAIKRLQATIDREEQIAKQPQAVQSLIRGNKTKCKLCKTGFIYYRREEADKYIFICDGCGKKYKAKKETKKQSHRTSAERYFEGA